MGDVTTTSAGPITPVKNLRICFWGVQGSCPLFPEANEVEEYKRLVAMDVLSRVLEDMRGKSSGGKGCRIEDLLGGPETPQAVEAYQRRLGTANLPVYGGDTTCVGIETAEGNFLVLDGGSGIRNCSKQIVQRRGNGPRDLHIFGTHEHLDHRSGLPFAQFCYVDPPFRLHIFGSHHFLSALDERYGVFSKRIGASTHLDDPIDFRVMSAQFDGTEIRNPAVPDFEDTAGELPWRVRDISEPIEVGKTRIRAFDVYHGPTRCLAYKIEHGEASFVFCTDHEVRRGTEARDPKQLASAEANARLEEYCRGVDLAYFDGQYFLDEYLGRKGIGNTLAVSRVDWGHGCMEDIVDRARRCGIKRTLIGHHDPERTWPARLQVDRWLQQQCAGQAFQIELAKSEGVIDL